VTDPLPAVGAEGRKELFGCLPSAACEIHSLRAALIQTDLPQPGEHAGDLRVVQRQGVCQGSVQDGGLALEFRLPVAPLGEICEIARDRLLQPHETTPWTRGLNCFHSRRISAGVSFR
jgi:hypothetical protein